MLRLAKTDTCISAQEAKQLIQSTKSKVGLFLLTEPPRSVPKAKPGLQSLAYRVLDTLTEDSGALDLTLKSFAAQRPRVNYQRVLVNRNDAEVMTTLGVVWLPQVRVVKNGKIMFRSSVSIGDNGQFLCQDVGGKSFVRRIESSGYINLVDALAAELDR